MTSKLIPSNPGDVTVIRKVTENIVTMSAPFARMGRIKIGGRGTLVRLQSGAVAVFSPTALTPAVKETVASLGELRYIAALDMEHHIFLGPWRKEYPNATVIGPEGLEEKRKKQSDVEDIPINVVFAEKDKASVRIGSDFDADFDYEFVDGHINKEIVFNYKPDRTLIQGDLLFNLPATEQYRKSNDPATTGILTRIFNAINNTNGAAMGQRRLIWYLISSGNRPSYNQSVARIAQWNFDRIIPCHGDVIETNGKGIFEKMMAWHLVAAKSDKKHT